MRAFIAAPIPENVLKELASFQRTLDKTQAQVSWVRPRSMHLTLKFLGETGENQLEPIKGILQGISVRHRPFTLRINALGAFPDIRSPRVIWAGMDSGADNLAALAADIEKDISPLGFPPEERPFSGHITLGRVRGNRNRAQLSALLEKIKDQPHQLQLVFPVESLILYKSTLAPAGPLYQTLATATLSTS